REILSGMIAAATDYALKCDIPDGMKRADVVAVVAAQLSYVPGIWDKLLGAPTAVRLARFPEKKPATKTSATKPATTPKTTKRATASKPATTRTRTTRSKTTPAVANPAA